jgi:hypothetical protein
MEHWNHRLIEHRNSADSDAEVYTTVHEVHYAKDGTPEGFALGASSPRTKTEAQWIVRAFDRSTIAWVDDASHFKDANGFDDYTFWGWIPQAREENLGLVAKLRQQRAEKG